MRKSILSVLIVVIVAVVFVRYDANYINALFETPSHLAADPGIPSFKPVPSMAKEHEYSEEIGPKMMTPAM